MGEQCGPPSKLTLTPLAEWIATEEPQPAVQAKRAIADLATRVCPQHLHPGIVLLLYGIVLLLYGYAGSEPVADAAVKLMLAITSAASEQAQQASMPQDLRQLVEHSHHCLLASLYSQEQLFTDHRQMVCEQLLLPMHAG